MDSLPPDPYVALGLPRDAPAGTIKTTYRKLVLKCHPDKVQDESLKQEAADRFHKIQSAYEIIGDEDRRSRYDAQCKLAELRRDVVEGGGGGSRGGVEVKTAGYKMPTESSRGGDFYARGPERYTRVSPQYEERRPSYAADEDYFSPAKAASRKFDEYERSSKRSSPKDDRPRAKVSTRDTKETERSSRKDKSRRTDKDVRKDRERKASYATVEEDDSEYDSYERRTKEKAAREPLYNTARKHYQEEEAGGDYFYSERASKLDSHLHMAQERIRGDRVVRDPEYRPEPERRPSPVRHASSKHVVDKLRREEGKPPVMIRTRSDRPKPSRRDTGTSSREKERSPVYEEDVRDSRRSEAKRPPTLAQTKSAPENIRPANFDRQRSYSVQEDFVEPPMPGLPRSNTMPVSPGNVREARGRKEGSKLRPEENYITPERTPEPEARNVKRYAYGQAQAYADDNEVATPDGFKTEVRRPSNERKFTRSPSPIKERERERQRPASARHATATQQPLMPRTTSYRYSEPVKETPSRPGLEREGSRLYGEMERKSPRPTARGGYPVPPENVKYTDKYGPENVRYTSNMRTGYDRKSDRPEFSRGNSQRPVYT